MMKKIVFKPMVSMERHKIFGCFPWCMRYRLTEDSYMVRQRMNRWREEYGEKITVMDVKVEDYDEDGLEGKKCLITVFYIENVN